MNEVKSTDDNQQPVEGNKNAEGETPNAESIDSTASQDVKTEYQRWIKKSSQQTA